MPAEADKASRPVWSPILHKSFLRLYLVYLLSFASTAVVESTAAWQLAASGAAPSFVALVSTAATLPIVLFVIPFGALADSLDRRKLIYVSQLWSAGAAAVLCAVSLFVAFPRWEYLWLVAANAIAMAVRLPSITSMAAVRVDEPDVANAMTLLGLGTSLTRIVGPVTAGFLIAYIGVGVSFFVACLLSLVAFVLTTRMTTRRRPDAIPAERFLGAIRVSISFTRQSPEFQTLLVTGFLFFFVGTCVFALGPMALSRRFSDINAIFMLALAAAGMGALLASWLLPRIRSHLKPNTIARAAVVALAISSLCHAFAASPWVGLVGSVVNGAGWLLGQATFSSRAQLMFPDWVRARGLAVHQAALISAVSIDSLIWGVVTDFVGFQVAFLISAMLALVLGLSPRMLKLLDPPKNELSPMIYWNEPALAIPPIHSEGPAVLQVTYHVDPEKIDAFLDASKTSRRLRLRSGALSWMLTRDIENPTVFVEQVIFQNWDDRQRHASRTTVADHLVRTQKISTLETPESFEAKNLIAIRVN